MNREYVESLILQSLIPELVASVEGELLACLNSPEIINIFVSILNSPTNESVLKGSILYLNVALRRQWDNFDEPTKADIRELIIPILQKYPQYLRIFQRIISFFMRSEGGFPEFFNFLRNDFDLSQYPFLLDLYSKVIKKFPIEFVQERIDILQKITLYGYQINNPEIFAQAAIISSVLTTLFEDPSYCLPIFEKISTIITHKDMNNDIYIILWAIIEKILQLYVEYPQCIMNITELAFLCGDNTNLPVIFRSFPMIQLTSIIRLQLYNEEIIDKFFNYTALFTYTHLKEETEYAGQYGSCLYYIGKTYQDNIVCRKMATMINNLLKNEDILQKATGIIFIYYASISTPKFYKSGLKKFLDIFRQAFRIHDYLVMKTLLDTLKLIISNDDELHPYLILLKPIIFLAFSNNCIISGLALDIYQIFSLHYPIWEHEDIFNFVWSQRDTFWEKNPTIFCWILSMLISKYNLSVIPEILQKYIFPISLDDSGLFGAKLSYLGHLIPHDDMQKLVPEIIPLLSTGMKNSDLQGNIVKFFNHIISILHYSAQPLFEPIKEDICTLVVNTENFNDDVLSLGFLTLKYFNVINLYPLLYERYLLVINSGKIDSFENSIWNKAKMMMYLTQEQLIHLLHKEVEIFSHFKKTDKSFNQTQVYGKLFICFRKYLKYVEDKNAFIKLLFDFIDEVLGSDKKEYYSSCVDVFSYILHKYICDYVYEYIQKFLQNFGNLSLNVQAIFIGLLGDFIVYVADEKTSNDIMNFIIFYMQKNNNNIPIEYRQDTTYVFNSYIEKFPNNVQNIMPFRPLFDSWFEEIINEKNENMDYSDLILDNICSMYIRLLAISDNYDEIIFMKSLVKYPPNDKAEIEPMSQKLLIVYQKFGNQFSDNAKAMFSCALAQFISMPPERRRINDEIFANLLMIFRNYMLDQNLQNLIIQKFADSPAKLERIKCLLAQIENM